MDESQIPIDIHAGKLLDWLVSRRICSKDWMKSLTQIRQLILQALRDMPENQAIADILSSGSQLNYYTCKDIVSVLRETEADSKNIFGYYSSQRMKDWQEIVRMYEKDSVYLAEIAQTIVRNVTYEVPSLRKQVSKVDATIDALRQKQTQSIKRSNQLLAQYSTMTSGLGIRGIDAKEELTQQLSHFPALISDISDKLASLKTTVLFYQGFVSTTTNSSPSLCPLIEYLTRKGNTTYFEYVNGEKPDLIEEVHTESLTKDSESPVNPDDAGIDFGDGIDYGDGIDFGDNENGSGSPGTGTTGSTGESFVHIQDPNAGSKRNSVEDINWDVSSALGSTAQTQTGSKIARGVHALTLVEYRDTRDSIVHELLELEAFLQQRIFEMTHEDDSPVHVLLESHLTSFNNDVQSMESMLTQVREVLTHMTSERLKMLNMIRENPKFCETIVRKLQQITELSEKAVAQAESMREKEQQLMHEKMNMIEQIPVLIRVTAHLESKLTQDISSRYKNRPVNIMAGAQVL